MRVLVIGGTGFVGAPLVGRLRALGHDVSTFHREAPATIRGDRERLAKSRDEFVRIGPEVVVDTIAYAEGDATGLVATFRGMARRLVVLSSQDVYASYGRLLGIEEGQRDPTLATEAAPLRSSRYPYRALARPGEMAYEYEKVLVECVVAGAGDLPATILRLPCVYGPGDPHHRARQYLQQMDSRATSIILDEAKAAWRWTRGYVDDVADAIALAAASPGAAGRIYNVGEEDALTEADWVRRIGRAAGWKGEVRAVAAGEVPAELAEPYDFQHDVVADTRLIRKELGYRERVGRDEGVQRMVAWEREQASENQ